jgi:hypothetical protein
MISMLRRRRRRSGGTFLKERHILVGSDEPEYQVQYSGQARIEGA